MCFLTRQDSCNVCHGRALVKGDSAREIRALDPMTCLIYRYLDTLIYQMPDRVRPAKERCQDDDQRLRTFLRRHRPVEFPYRRPDAGSRAVRGRPSHARRLRRRRRTSGSTSTVRLAATGAGHGTFTAVLLGLEGHRPEEIETDEMERRVDEMRATGTIAFGGSRRDRAHRAGSGSATVDDPALPPQRHDDHGARRGRHSNSTARRTSRWAAASSSPKPRARNPRRDEPPPDRWPSVPPRRCSSSATSTAAVSAISCCPSNAKPAPPQRSTGGCCTSAM